ncbi:MAG: histidine kinase, partial [Stigonema ocellatum SAG 48.90 = DSM 106950]|nr:histidine kinase [Stigonema ocellatum SAG 48.90 = DSM 106950]
MVVGINTNRRGIGVFSSRGDVEGALHELRDSGFPMDRASVIAQNSDSTDDIAGAEVRERVGNKADEGATVGALSGGTLGGLTGLLVGLGALAIPGIGPIMLAGATATALATTLAGAGIGAVAGSLVGGLIGLGIPEEEARAYNSRVERGHYLVIIDGTDSEIARARAILERRGIEDFAVYDQPNTKSTDFITSVTPIPAVPNGGVGFTKHAIGYFQTRNDAEAAINDLRSAGFPLSQISLIHRDSLQGELFIGVTESDRFDAMRLGLPDARARFYNERVHQGDYVLIASGTEDEINHAAVILSRRGIQQWEMYDPTTISPASVQTPRRAIGVFPHGRDAEAAITELRNAGFPLNQVSLIAKDADGNNPVGGVNTQP